MRQLSFVYLLIATAMLNADQRYQQHITSTHNNHPDEIVRRHRQQLEENPHDFQLTLALAQALYKAGKKEEALQVYDQASTLNPQAEEVYFNKGIIHNELNQHEKAAESFLKAAHCSPTNEQAYIHAIKAFRSCKQIDTGLQIAKRSVKAIHTSAELRYRYGLLCKDKELYKKALKQFAQAVRMDPYNKHYLLELGNTLYLLDDFQEALYIFERLLEITPQDTHVLYNFGVTLKALGYIDQAIQVYDRILEAHPSCAPVQFSRALAHLVRGDFGIGFAAYEWRWNLGAISKKYTHIPSWNGQDLQGKTILIYSEQGLGDTIMFIRYAALAAQQGAYVIVDAQPALRDVLSLCPYIDLLHKSGATLPHVDYQVALLSMPHIMGTTLDNIPYPTAYLHADPTLQGYWHEQLAQTKGIKIGICWQGNSNYATAELRHAVAHKSMNPETFKPLTQLPGAQIYSLQLYGPHATTIPEEIVTFQEIDTEHGRFMDTVAIMKNLDLVISVDTSICHLAGALGVPVWTLLPHQADWRWLLNRTDSPWYNSMRLFRQPTTHDWDSVIQECCNLLQEVVNGTRSIELITQEKGTTTYGPAPLLATKSSYLPSVSTPYHAKKNPAAIKKLQTAQTIESLKISAQEPDLPDIAHELARLTKELNAAQQQLAQTKISLFDSSTIELLRSCVQTHDQHHELMNSVTNFIVS